MEAQTIVARFESKFKIKDSRITQVLNDLVAAYKVEKISFPQTKYEIPLMVLHPASNKDEYLAYVTFDKGELSIYIGTIGNAGVSYSNKLDEGETVEAFSISRGVEGSACFLEAKTANPNLITASTSKFSGEQLNSYFEKIGRPIVEPHMISNLKENGFNPELETSKTIVNQSMIQFAYECSHNLGPNKKFESEFSHEQKETKSKTIEIYQHLVALKELGIPLSPEQQKLMEDLNQIEFSGTVPEEEPTSEIPKM